MSRVSLYSRDEHRVIVDEVCLASRLKNIKEQLLIVSVAGPFQTGKSSFISYLTGDVSVESGEGSEETTTGIWVHGPYELNALKRRWNAPEVDGDTTKVLFIDTEGSDGDSGLNHDENKVVMCELTVPFLAISQVCVFLNQSNLAKAASETFKYLLEMTGNICSGANSGECGDGNMKIIDISINVGRFKNGEMDEYGTPVVVAYRPDTVPGMFEKVSEFLRKVQSPRLCLDGSPLIIDEFWPLPSYDGRRSIFEQDHVFTSGFKAVACRLILMLDEIRRNHSISGAAAFQAFTDFKAELGHAKLSELAESVRRNAELSSVEQILKPVLNDITQKYKMEITSRLRSLNDELIIGSIHPGAVSEFDVLVTNAKREIEQCPGVSDSMRRSGRWSVFVAPAQEAIELEAWSAKNAYSSALDEKLESMIYTHVFCKLQDELVEVITDISKSHQGKREIDSKSMKTATDKLASTRDRELEKKCLELEANQTVKSRCKLRLSGDMASFVENLMKTAQPIVDGNRKIIQERVETFLKVALDTGSRMIQDLTSFGCDVIKEKLIHDKSRQ